MTQSIQVDAAALTNELAWLTKAKGRCYGTPALRSVQLSIVVGALRLRRTDYELFQESMLTGTGGGQADILVDPARLRELLKGARGPATLFITDDDQKLNIDVGGALIRLKASASMDDYPKWPVFVRRVGEQALVSTGEVTRALTSVGEDQTLPSLTVVRFEDSAMVSTNRFRLTCVTYDTHGKPLVANVAGEALRLFAAGENLVTVEGGSLDEASDASTAVRISSGDRSLIARLADTEFPKWRQLIPDEDALSLSVMIRRDDLLNALHGEYATLTIEPESISVLSTDKDGEVEVTRRFDILRLVRGAALPFTVRIARENLVRCLKGISTGAVLLSASSPAKPVVLQGIGDADLHLVMPVRMAEAQAASGE